MRRIRQSFAWLLSWPRKILAWLPVIVSPRWVNDTTGFVGLGLLAWGCGWIYPPLALIVLGVVFLGLAILGARRKQGGRDAS